MKLSIVIPCRNEEKYIERCINSVLVAIRDIKAEIIVADGKSMDKTPEILMAIALKNQEVQVLKNEKLTTPIGLNLGINASKGKCIAILGAHSEVHENYFKEGLAILNSNDQIGCVGGVLENVFEDHISKYIGKAMTSGFGVGNAYFRTGTKDGEVDTVAFGIYPRLVFEKVGVFDENLPRNQDDEFNFRVKQAGFRIILSSAIKAKYYVRGNYKKLFSQYYQYGYWKVKVNKKHGEITTLRQLVPPVFVAGNFIGIGLSLVNNYFFIVYLTTLGVYFLAGSFFSIKCSSSLKEWINVLFSFFILHSAYGLGYLEGIWRFLVFRERDSIKRQEITR